MSALTPLLQAAPQTVGNPAVNIGIFVAFVVVTLVIVIRASKTNTSSADYYAGGRGFSGTQNGTAIAGDYLSAASFLGIVGAIALYGYDGFLYSIGFLVAWLVALLLVAELMRNTGKFTMADVLSFRLRQRPVRMAAAISTLAVCFFYLLAQMAGAGGLVSLLLGLDGVMGLKGWQWLFIIEGVPSVLLGIVTWFYLTDRPEKADWLSAEQKAWLKGKLDAEVAAKQAAKHFTFLEALSSSKVLALSAIYFGFVASLYGMQFWLPQIVKAFGLTNAQTGFVTAIPYAFGTVAMILWARRSDATRERVFHVGAPLLLTALALAVSSYITDPTMTMVVLTVAAIGVFCTFAVFWTLPTAWLAGTAAAGAIALINSIGNLAGFLGPYLIGWVKETTGSTSTGLLVLSLLPLAAGLLVFLGSHETKTEFVEAK